MITKDNLKPILIGFVIGVVSSFLSSLVLFKASLPKNNEKYITTITELKKDLEFLDIENQKLKYELSSIQIDTIILEAKKDIKKYKTIKKETDEEKIAYISYSDSIKLAILKWNITN